MEPEEIARYVVTANKQHVKTGFRSNRYAHNNRRTAGSGVFYYVPP
jgi:hypothetical protein